MEIGDKIEIEGKWYRIADGKDPGDLALHRVLTIADVPILGRFMDSKGNMCAMIGRFGGSDEHARVAVYPSQGGNYIVTQRAGSEIAALGWNGPAPAPAPAPIPY